MRKTEDYIRTKADEVAFEKGCYIDFEEVDMICDFFATFLRFSKGSYAGKPFIFADWQREDIVTPLFGWKNPNHYRRFRKALIYIPKKNTKSTLCSGFTIYGLCGDGEQGAEVYTCAGDKAQASIVFDEAAKMVEASPALSSFIHVKKSIKQMTFKKTNSFMKAMSREAYTKEGFNISMLIFDEIHTQPDRRMIDTLAYGGIARKQPLNIMITTAGDDVTLPYYDEYKYAKDILAGANLDITYFPYIREADEKDDIWAEETWKKANPAYGTLIDPEEFKAAAEEAKQKPSMRPAFERYRLNKNTSKVAEWIPQEMWAKCINAQVERPGAGAVCYAGVDLSSTIDIAAIVLYFPENHVVLPYFWVPKETVKNRRQSRRQKYDEWAAENLICVTDGATLDYDLLKGCLVMLRDEIGYDIRRVGVDPHNATQFTNNLIQLGFDCVFIRQTMPILSEPTKKLEELVINAKLTHYGHPVLSWMNRNVRIQVNADRDIKIHKERSKECIDGMSGLVNAIRVSMEDEVVPSLHSVRAKE